MSSTFEKKFETSNHQDVLDQNNPGIELSTLISEFLILSIRLLKYRVCFGSRHCVFTYREADNRHRPRASCYRTIFTSGARGQLGVCVGTDSDRSGDRRIRRWWSRRAD